MSWRLLVKSSSNVTSVPPRTNSVLLLLERSQAEVRRRLNIWRIGSRGVEGSDKWWDCCSRSRAAGRTG